MSYVTLAVLNQSDKKVEITQKIQTNEQKENVQQVCPRIPAMPWNFDEELGFTEL